MKAAYLQLGRFMLPVLVIQRYYDSSVPALDLFVDSIPQQSRVIITVVLVFTLKAVGKLDEHTTPRGISE